MDGRTRLPGLVGGHGAGIFLQASASHEFISLERRETGRVSGSAAFTKACCVSSVPSPHLVILTVLKMYPSCLPCSLFQNMGQPQGESPHEYHALKKISPGHLHIAPK